MHAESFVISVRLEQVAGGSEQLQADQGRHESTDEEEESDGQHVEDGDALVVLGQQPALQAVVSIDVMLFRHYMLFGYDDIRYCGTHFVFPCFTAGALPGAAAAPAGDCKL